VRMVGVRDKYVGLGCENSFLSSLDTSNMDMSKDVERKEASPV